MLPSQVQAARAPGASLAPGVATDERAARHTLRAQIARLERELADAFVTAFPMGGLPQPAQAAGHARLLDLGELEVVRDELAERLREARLTIARRADEQAEKRVILERMLLRPADYKFARISCQELGEPGLRRVAGASPDGPHRHADGLVAGQALLRLSVTRGPRRPLRRAVARAATRWGCGRC